MLQIECPWCGVRDEIEFRFGGEVLPVRPPLEQTDDAEWAEYLFFRDNLKGEQHERWCHDFGCGLWFRVLRNTVSHEIVEVGKLGNAAAVTKAESP